MIVVLDASAGYELLLDSALGDHIRQALQEVDLVIAPDLFISELANTCWKAVKFKALSSDEAIRGLRFGLSLIDNFVNSADLIVEALSQACLADHPVYDLTYLTLAKREAAKLLTLDKQLKKLASKAGVACFDLGVGRKE